MRVCLLGKLDAAPMKFHQHDWTEAPTLVRQEQQECATTEVGVESRRPQPYTKSHQQSSIAESRRNSLPQEKAYQWAIK